jgi:hypothetical protein
VRPRDVFLSQSGITVRCSGNALTQGIDDVREDEHHPDLYQDQFLLTPPSMRHAQIRVSVPGKPFRCPSVAHTVGPPPAIGEQLRITHIGQIHAHSHPIAQPHQPYQVACLLLASPQPDQSIEHLALAIEHMRDAVGRVLAIAADPPQLPLRQGIKEARSLK